MNQLTVGHFAPVNLNALNEITESEHKYMPSICVELDS